MIKTITIRNFLLIEEAFITLSPNFSVFTGESGAGKSLVFKALRFCLGAKIDKSYIGQWDDVAQVVVTFLVREEVASFLHKIDIPCEKELYIEHYLYEDKRVCKLNGTKVSIKILKALAKLMVLDSAQGQSMLIQDQGFQNQYINELVDQDVLDEFEFLRESLSNLKRKKQDMEKILENEDEPWLLHQVAELREKVPYEETVSDLQALVDKNQKIEVIKKEWLAKKDYIQSIRKGLYQLNQVKVISIEDLVLEMEASLDSVEQTFQSEMSMDFEEQNEALEAKTKLSGLNDLARKHRVSVDKLHALSNQYSDTLQKIEEAKRDFESIGLEVVRLEERLVVTSKKLMDEKLGQGNLLTAYISDKLVLMGMEQASFKIDFEEKGHSIYPVFKIKSNPGQPFKSLQDCLSGGELSRLCILLTIYQNPQLILILDEIDTGVSGLVGNKIRDLLRDLSLKQQILCISHLAQVASGAHQHFVLTKIVEDKIAKTSLHVVLGQDRAIELSRLMCGHVDQAMVDQAKRLLDVS